MSFTPPASGVPEPPPETPRQREERRREEHRRDLALTESRRAFNEIPQIQAYVLTETYIQYEGDTEVLGVYADVVSAARAMAERINYRKIDGTEHLYDHDITPSPIEP